MAKLKAASEEKLRLKLGEQKAALSKKHDEKVRAPLLPCAPRPSLCSLLSAPCPLPAPLYPRPLCARCLLPPAPHSPLPAFFAPCSSSLRPAATQIEQLKNKLRMRLDKQKGDKKKRRQTPAGLGGEWDGEDHNLDDEEAAAAASLAAKPRGRPRKTTQPAGMAKPGMAAARKRKSPGQAGAASPTGSARKSQRGGVAGFRELVGVPLVGPHF